MLWCTGVCVAVSLAFYLGFVEWVMRTPSLVSCHAVSIDHHILWLEIPSFLYEAAIESARSKNAAWKSSKSDPVR